MEGGEEYQPKRRAVVQEKLFLLVGPTRSGKSTFINTVLGQVEAVEGQNRSARSTTREIKVHNKINSTVQERLDELFPGQGITKINFIDTIGFRDTSVKYTDKEIQEMIKSELLGDTPCDQIDAIFIMDNALDTYIALRDTYLKIKEFFGEVVQESVYVLITHGAEGQTEKYELALQERIEDCNDLGLPYMIWESKDVSEEQKLMNFRSLFNKVSTSLKPYQILQLSKLEDELLQDAKWLQLDPVRRDRILR